MFSQCHLGLLGNDREEYIKASETVTNAKKPLDKAKENVEKLEERSVNLIVDKDKMGLSKYNYKSYSLLSN